MTEKVYERMTRVSVRSNGLHLEAILTLEGEQHEPIVIGSVLGKLIEVDEPYMRQWFHMMGEVAAKVIGAMPDCIGAGSGLTKEEATKSAEDNRKMRESGFPTSTQ